MQKAIVLIPALDPNEKLIGLIKELHKKLIADTILFFVSFIIQKYWVFQNGKE